MAELKRRRYGSVSTNTGGQLPGQHLLRPGAKATIRTPDYKKATIPTVAHIVPSIVTADDRGRKKPKSFEPYRDAHGIDGLVPWFVILDVAHRVGIGDDAKTFIMCDPLDETRSRVDDTPYGILYRRIARAVKNAAGNDNRVICGNKKISPKLWSDLLPNENTSYEAQAFMKPSKGRTGFISVLMFIDNGKLVFNGETGRPLGASPGDIAQLLMLSGSATETLRNRANDEAEGFDVSVADWGAAYKFGDFTQLDGSGRFMVIYNPDHHHTAPDVMRTGPAVTVDADAEYDPDVDAGRASGKRRAGGFASYEINFVPKVKLPVAGGGSAVYSEQKLFKNPDVAKTVLANYDEIWRYFYLPSVEEQCLWLAQAYRSKPELLLYGWADNREFFTADVNAVLAARVQSLVPAASQTEDPDTDDEIDSVYDDDTDDETVDSVYDDDSDDDVPPAPRTAKAMGKAAAAVAAAVQDDIEPDEDYTSPFGLGDGEDDEVEADPVIVDDMDDDDDDDELYLETAETAKSYDEPDADEDGEADSSMALILAKAKAAELARRQAAAKKAQPKASGTAPAAKAKAKPSLADLAARANAAKAKAAAATGKKRRPTDGLPTE